MRIDGDVLVPDRQHHAVERIAEQRFDQSQIGKIAIEPGGRSLVGFLNRMRRKFDRDAARIADAVAHPLREDQVVPVAR